MHWAPRADGYCLMTRTASYCCTDDSNGYCLMTRTASYCCTDDSDPSYCKDYGYCLSSYYCYVSDLTPYCLVLDTALTYPVV